MTRWFRFYDEALNDPKILKLSDNMYRVWVGLLCVASKNDGVLPPVDDLVLMLRMKADKVQAALNSLVKSGLIDEDGANLSPHNWDKRQFKSDTSTERVKRFRNVTKAVSETAPETEQRQSRTERDRIVEGASHFTEGSKALASAFWKALGFESPLHIPPQFAGVDWRAVSWESAGWTVDMIDAEARRIGPDKPLSYFEKVFATAFAKRQAPLPRVEILEPQPATVRQQSNGKSGNISAACDKLIAIARANYHGESTQDAFGFGAHEDTARILPYRRS